MPRSVKALDCQQNQNRNPHYPRESHDHPHARDGEESVTGLLSQRRGVALLLVAWGLASACVGTAPSQRSALQQKIDKNGVSATELRLRLYELPGQLGAMVETTADRIRVESSDPAVRRRALLWKADGTPALYTAALRPDPLAGALDLWLLVEQMHLYFREGVGKNAFGAQQPLAITTVTRMLAITRETVAALVGGPEALERGAARVQQFARSHPIEAGFSARDTALIELARLAEAESGMLASVGQATETLSDISLRLNAYVTLVPKVARWQAELAAEEVTGRDSLRGTLDDIQAIGDAARRASSLLADIPGAAREASVPVRELLDQQRTEVLAAIPGAAREASVPVRELLDQQRTEILAAVDRERLTISEFITAEREAALAVVSEERRAALASISQERAVVLAALDAMAKRSIEDASGRARGMADYVFGRALILIAASALLFAAGYRLARGRRRRGDRSK